MGCQDQSHNDVIAILDTHLSAPSVASLILIAAFLAILCESDGRIAILNAQQGLRGCC